VATRFPPPRPEPLVLPDKGRPDQAIALVAWPLTDFYADTLRSRAAMLAGEVLGNRVLDRVRIEQGATYSPETQAVLSESFPGYGVAWSMVEIPPDRMAGFFADVSAITAAMARDGISQDELDRARNPRVSGIRKAQLTNEYWLGRLAGSIADPRRLDLIRTTFSDYDKVTTADVRQAARDWFVPDRAWRLEIKSAADAPPASKSTAAR
jgi:zinc protease